MSGWRAQVAWLVRGRAATRESIERLETDLRALAQRVDALQSELHRLAEQTDRELATLRQRQLAEFDAVREAVARATDDLVARITAAEDGG